MTDNQRLIAYIEKQVRDAEYSLMFHSWLLMTKDEILDHKLKDWFADRGLLRLKP